MPAPLTYPGVYVEEIPSGVRTITGVGTSITAFIGRALRGPVNKAWTITSYADFERTFGGLWLESSLGYAVRDFYRNGGSQAIIVRLFHGIPPAAKAVADAIEGAATSTVAATEARKAATDFKSDPDMTIADRVAKAIEAAAAAGKSLDDVAKEAAKAVVAEQITGRAKLSVGDIPLEAAYPGRQGENLRAYTEEVPENVAAEFGLKKGQVFNLIVFEVNGARERHLNLSVADGPRRIDKVLEAESRLVRCTLPATPPTKLVDDDAVTAAEKAVAKETKSGAVTAATTAALAKAQEELHQASNGYRLSSADFTPPNAFLEKAGLYALEQADLFNLLCIPPYLGVDPLDGDVDLGVLSDATAYCEKRRAMLLVDPKPGWADANTVKSDFMATGDNRYPGVENRNAALFFPRIRQENPLRENRVEPFAPCGAIAGVFARTDSQRGVWKAPAGLDATVVGARGLTVNLTDEENGLLNPLGINCLRAFAIGGRVVWGARTLRGADQLADEYKYVPVRRVALYIEESLYRGTHWVVFEPNDEPLWAQIRLNVGAFMHNLFRQGAFQGQSPRDAYFVRCDKETTTQNDVNLGIVNIVVGFAPLKPAEFVVIKVQQIAGQIEV